MKKNDKKKMNNIETPDTEYQENNDLERNHPSCSGSGRISRNFNLRQILKLGRNREED